MFNSDEFYRYINSNLNNGYKLGAFDCFTFVSGYYKLRNNQSYFDDYVGKYKTKKGWLGLIKRSGYSSLEDLLNKNFTKKNISQAARGDLVLLNNEALGLCDGLYSIFLSRDDSYLYNFIETNKCDGVYEI